MKQLQLFEAPTAPKRKLTRKRIERIERAYETVRTRPKMPTAPLWRRLVKQGRYVMEGLVEKPMPRAIPKQPAGRTLCGSSVLGQVDAPIDALVEDIGAIMVEEFDHDNDLWHGLAAYLEALDEKGELR